MSSIIEVSCVNDNPIRTAISEAVSHQSDKFKVRIINYGTYAVEATDFDGVVSYSVKKIFDGLYDEYVALEMKRSETTDGRELVGIDKEMLNILSRIT